MPSGWLSVPYPRAGLQQFPTGLPKSRAGTSGPPGLKSAVTRLTSFQSSGGRCAHTVISMLQVCHLFGLGKKRTSQSLSICTFGLFYFSRKVNILHRTVTWVGGCSSSQPPTLYLSSISQWELGQQRQCPDAVAPQPEGHRCPHKSPAHSDMNVTVWKL